MIDERSPDPATAPRRPRFTVKGTITAVAALGWAIVAIRDSSEANTLARKLRSGDIDDRQIAARELRYHAKTRGTWTSPSRRWRARSTTRARRSVARQSARWARSSGPRCDPSRARPQRGRRRASATR